jgi:drug/metabolite transporter (DMT)-like permease
MQTSYLRGVLFCLVATVSWGCMFPVMTSALTQMDPFNFTAIRYTIAAIPFAVLLLAREGKGAFNLKGERHLLAWLFGTAGFAGFNFLIFLGQQLAGPTGALSAAIMTATMPLLALPVNWVMRGVRPPLYSIGFILLAFVGVVLVITKGNPLGAFDQAQTYIVDITLFVGALFWVIYTSGASFFPTWSPYRYTAMTTLLGLVSMYAINVVLIELRYIPVPSSGQAWTIMPQFLYMSLVAGAIAVLSWNIGNKIITPVNGVLFMNVVPVAAFAASALSGIVPTPVQLAGAAITVAALVMNNLYQRQRVQRESASPYGSGKLPSTQAKFGNIRSRLSPFCRAIVAAAVLAIVAAWPKLPRPSSTLPSRRFAAVRRFGRDRSEADMTRPSGAGRSNENDPQQTSDVQCNRLPACRMAGLPAD